MLGSVGRRRGDPPKKFLRGRVFRGRGGNSEGGRRGVWRGPWGEFTGNPSGGPYGGGAAAAAKIEIRPIRNGQRLSAGQGSAGGRKAGALRGHALSDCRAACIPERRPGESIYHRSDLSRRSVFLDAAAGDGRKIWQRSGYGGGFSAGEGKLSGNAGFLQGRLSASPEPGRKLL